VARLALQLPVLLRERKRLRLVSEEIEVEARLLLLMQLVAWESRRVEARLERGDVLLGLGQLQGLLGERQPQQQDVRARPVAQQRRHLGRAAVVEQEVGPGGEQELVGDLLPERRLEMALG